MPNLKKKLKNFYPAHESEVDSHQDEDLNGSKLKRYEGLLEFSRVLLSSMDIRNIQKISVKKIKKLLNCEYAKLFLIDYRTKELKAPNLGNNGEEFSFSVDENSFVGSCAHFKAILHISDLNNDLRLAREPEFIRELGPREILLAPLVHNGELLGVLKLINKSKGAFDSNDIQFMGSIVDQLAVIVENAFLIETLHLQYLQVTNALGDAISKKDHYTGGHARRVGVFAEMIAKEMDFTSRELLDIKLSAALHDVGKIGIEDKILKKKSPLTDEEFEVMREHPRLGFEILEHVDSSKDVINGIRYHHERFDGRGYPYGLKGDDIPLISQIVSVADSFDAMISTRPYRKGLPPMVAYEEIVKNSGQQFGPKVVEAFKRAFEKSSMYRTDKLAPKKKAS